MSDDFDGGDFGDGLTEVSSQSWIERLMSAIGGVLVGGLLFLVSFPLLFWNEGRAVRMDRDIAQGASQVVSVQGAKVEAGNEGKLIHIEGEATTKDILKDPVFNISANALRLNRNVEMYAWVEKEKSETKKKLGGKKETVTTTTYEKEWTAAPADSSKFKQPEGHKNPKLEYPTDNWQADRITVGDFVLSKALAGQIKGSESLSIQLDQLPEEIRKRARMEAASLYIPAPVADPKDPPKMPPDEPKPQPVPPAPGETRIGDMRISFNITKPAVVSVAAVQKGDSFVPFVGGEGNKLELLNMGSVSAAEMFKRQADQNKMMTWILRVVGFVLMAVGIYLVFNPLVVLADVLPILGDFLSVGIGLFAGLVAAFFSLITISIAWIFYRPILGISLLAIAGGIIAALFMLRRKKPAVVEVPATKKKVPTKKRPSQ